MEQIFFRALYALLTDKQAVKITTTRNGDKLTLLINKDSKLITMTGTPEEVDNGIIDHLKVTANETEQGFNVTVQDAPDAEDESKSEKKSTSSSRKKASKKKAVPAKKSAPASKKKSPVKAYSHPMEIGEPLQAICGAGPLSRVEVTKKVWAYIKEHNLQNKKDTKIIDLDDTLKKVFGDRATMSMFDLTKGVNQFLTPVKKDDAKDKKVKPAAAKEEANEKDIAEAKEKLKKFTDALDMGAKLMKSGEYDDAIEIYEKAVTLAPEGNTAAAQKLEAAKKAKDEHERSLKKNEFDNLMKLGLTQRTERKYEDSLETFKRALELFPDNAEAVKQVAAAEKWIKALEEL